MLLREVFSVIIGLGIVIAAVVTADSVAPDASRADTQNLRTITYDKSKGDFLYTSGSITSKQRD